MRRLPAVMIAALIVFLIPVWPAAAKPKVVEFPPGTWRADAVWTGAISNGNITASLTSPAVFKFQLQVDPNGTVTDGHWTLASANISESLGSLGSASAVVNGEGNLSGTGTTIKVDGTYHIAVAIPSVGVSGVALDIPVTGTFSPTTASCTFVQGDLATQGRADQQAAGFATSVTAPFTAMRIAAPGDQGNTSWDEAYVDLVNQMTTLAGNTHPDVNDMMNIVHKVEDFQVNLAAASTCSDAPKNLEKGKQPYNWFIEQYSNLLAKILSDPSGYTGSDIADMLFSAVQLGAVGSAAPDQDTAINLEAMFQQVLGQKLDADISAGDKNDALLIYLAAAQAGFNDLAGKAHQFASP